MQGVDLHNLHQRSLLSQIEGHHLQQLEAYLNHLLKYGLYKA